jgi:hypothetical protein
VPAQELLRVETVPGFERVVALAAQVTDDDVPDDRLVVDDQDSRHPRIVPGAGLRNPEFDSPKSLESVS